MDVGTDTDVDQVMESGDAVQPEQSESASLSAEADFKARVRAAYVSDPGFADSASTKDVTFNDGLWFSGQALAIPWIATLRQECMKV